MELHIHIHHHDEKTLSEIKSINQTLVIMGQKLDAIKDQLASINDSTNNIAADLERLAGQISGGLSAEEADSVVSDLQATADKLKQIAAVNPETPAQPTEPTQPTEPGTGTDTGDTNA